MNENDVLICIWANPRRFVKLSAVNIRTVGENPVPFPNWSSSPLVHKVPVETSKWSMLCALVLEKQRTLLSTKLFQVSERNEAMIRCDIGANV